MEIKNVIDIDDAGIVGFDEGIDISMAQGTERKRPPQLRTKMVLRLQNMRNSRMTEDGSAESPTARVIELVWRNLVCRR